MGNLNWQATTPQQMRSKSTPTPGGGSGGPKKSAVAESLAMKQPLERNTGELAKAKADLASGRITRQQFNAIVARKGTLMGSQGAC